MEIRAKARADKIRVMTIRSRQLGHGIVRWVAHDEESIAMCPLCSARIYVRFDVDPPVVDGEALDEVCPG